MRFVIENPPFGTPWSGSDAKAGQEDAVKEEHKKGFSGRWGAGLPGGGDSQLLFLQSAVAKMDDKLGRAAIIENGSPLFTGGVSSGESQVRRWLLENDLIEAIIAMPIDLFYNTGIATYVWILSRNKRPERKDKIQLIDASQIFHKLRKPLGNKKNEFSPEDRAEITRLYANFEENEICKIYPNTEFIYREYTVMQPLQRSYGFTEERIQNMLQAGALKSLWDEMKVAELEEKGSTISAKERKTLAEFQDTKQTYEEILQALDCASSNEKWMSPEAFMPVLKRTLAGGKNKGQIIYDKATKDTEIVRWDEDIEDYMAREVLPHVPDAKWFWEENLSAKKPVIKTGAEIPFTRYFYKYQQPEPSEVLAERFSALESVLDERIRKLFGKA